MGSRTPPPFFRCIGTYGSDSGPLLQYHKKKLRVFCLFDVCKLATDERKTVKYTTVQYCKLSSSRTPLVINSQKWLEGTVPIGIIYIVKRGRLRFYPRLKKKSRIMSLFEALYNFFKIRIPPKTNRLRNTAEPVPRVRLLLSGKIVCPTQWD